MLISTGGAGARRSFGLPKNPLKKTTFCGDAHANKRLAFDKIGNAENPRFADDENRKGFIIELVGK
jgi:hypothetical protein